jgi:hypothetical protein
MCRVMYNKCSLCKLVLLCSKVSLVLIKVVFKADFKARIRRISLDVVRSSNLCVVN